MHTPAAGSPARSVVILAGGASRRMGRDKATVPIGDATLLGRVVERISDIPGLEHVVVVGSRTSDPGEALGPAYVRYAAHTRLAFIADRWPGEGPLGGMVAGLQHVGQLVGAEAGEELVDAEGVTSRATQTRHGVLVLSCDLPNLAATSLLELFEQFENPENPENRENSEYPENPENPENARPDDLETEREEARPVEAVVSRRADRAQPLHSVYALAAAVPLERAFEGGERRLSAVLNGLRVRYIEDHHGSSADADTPEMLEELLRSIPQSPDT